VLTFILVLFLLVGAIVPTAFATDVRALASPANQRHPCS
jgi:hypothetical protein